MLATAFAAALWCAPGLGTAAPMLGTGVSAQLGLPGAPGIIGSGTATIGAGAEFSYLLLGMRDTADFSEGKLSLGRFTGPLVGAVNGDTVWTFAFDPAFTITGITELDDNLPNGVRVSAFSAHSATFTLGPGAQALQTDYVANYAFTFASAVPEPASLVLVGLGLVALRGSRQRHPVAAARAALRSRDPWRPEACAHAS